MSKIKENKIKYNNFALFFMHYPGVEPFHLRLGPNLPPSWTMGWSWQRLPCDLANGHTCDVRDLK